MLIPAKVLKIQKYTGCPKAEPEAARETARQIRLRNLSGIILVDFVNMDDPEMEETLFQEFRFYLAKDPIQTTLVDITALGLAEVTRKKYANHSMK